MVLVSKPANIALIKYMGKDETLGNVPSNSSLSYPMSYLKTWVEISENSMNDTDLWEPLTGHGYSPISLSETGKAKFLKHFRFLKKELNLTKSYIIRSANNFPSDCGLASSASSFAALTQAAFEVSEKNIDLKKLPQLSQAGSGSSCRSFSDTWCLWQGSEVSDVKLPQNNLLHALFILEESKKIVSSSEAHQRIKTSENNVGRGQRASQRLEKLIAALKDKNWKLAYEITWAEFWDMHVLFETSKPPFSYMTAESLKALRALQDYWILKGEGPLVTMDAGANVHMLWREDQKDNATAFLTHWQQSFKILYDPRFGKL